MGCGSDDRPAGTLRVGDRLAAAPPAAEPDPPAKAKPALLAGGPPIPASLLAESINAGATLKPVHHPGPNSVFEPGYRPSIALDEFVRCRDLTCRWPGDDRPAEFYDPNHEIAHALGGPTHPSKVKCLRGLSLSIRKFRCCH